MPDYLLHNKSTERLHFRRVHPSDADTWLDFYRDPASTRYWEGIPADPERACKEQFERIFERYEKGLGGMNSLLDKKTNDLVGLAGLLVQEVDGSRELEIAYSLLPAYRGLGYAREAAGLCRDTAFQNRYASSLISIIHTSNLPSQKVATAIGMKRDTRTTYKNNPVFIYRISVSESLRDAK